MINYVPQMILIILFLMIVHGGINPARIAADSNPAAEPIIVTGFTVKLTKPIGISIGL
jgi:hypothetical protein